MRGLFGFFFCIFWYSGVWAQIPIDHYEGIIYDSSLYKYIPGDLDPGPDWMIPTYDDALWSWGRGGFGYGDGDDRTVLSPTLSVFLRTTFSLADTVGIGAVLLAMDYDDGFIAYINGVEIARSNMGSSSLVSFDQTSSGLHEALLYRGLEPEYFLLPKVLWSSLLVPGTNYFSVQVHNDNINSSDLTAAPFLLIGLTQASISYGKVPPSWFVPPVDFQSSNLPIIVLNTNGQFIYDEPRIVAEMGIIDNGAGNRNAIMDPYNDFFGKISIELRGESSQSFGKKSYRIETQDDLGNNLNVSLLGMPAENDWVLYAPYSDKSLIRNILAFKQGRDLGAYAPRTRLAELVLNGVYEGVYVLMEKIKRDSLRVNIAKLTPFDISGDQLTGGYLLRVDKMDFNDYPAWTADPIPQQAGVKKVSLQFYDPKGFDLTWEQKKYIYDFMHQFESALSGSGFGDAKTGYRKYIDLSSFIDFMLIQEIGKNIDGYIFSTYMYKDKDSWGGKLHMGPLWDFNLAYGNVDYWANAQYAPGWMWSDSHRMYWFRRLISDPFFASHVKCRWTALRQGKFKDEYFTQTIDSLAFVLDEAQQRNFSRWRILGKYIWPNQFVGNTYAEEIDFLKNWILTRLSWMDNFMPGDCEPLPASIVVYPNPFSNALYVHVDNFGNDPLEIHVYTTLGNLIHSFQFSAGDMVWDGTGIHGDPLPQGLYLIEIRSKGKVIGKRKIVKN